MAYRTTESYADLKKICTVKELMIIDLVLGPPVNARPDYIGRK